MTGEHERLTPYAFVFQRLLQIGACMVSRDKSKSEKIAYQNGPVSSETDERFLDHPSFNRKQLPTVPGTRQAFSLFSG
jgi:hypothetical protein